jgi:hypothetical protein
MAIKKKLIGVDATLVERGKRYGDFKDHARVTQALKKVIRYEIESLHPDCNPFDPEQSFLTDTQQEALDMICHKIGRIVCGDPNYSDSWHDIAGYAKLEDDKLKKEGK